MPFTRPGSGSAASEDAGPGSFKEDAEKRLSVSMHSLQQQRSRLSGSHDGMSFSEYSSSHGSLRRPERRTSANFTRKDGFVRQQGFLAEEKEHALEAPVTSPRPPVGPGGLLSREFSSDSLPAHRPATKSQELKVQSRISFLTMQAILYSLSIRRVQNIFSLISVLTSSLDLQERLQICYEKSPAEPVEGGDVDPALLLRTLQVFSCCLSFV